MKKILTIIFDGFGIREEKNGNAVKEANMHAFENFWNKYPHTTLYASEERVGLLKGQLGNSEVGHMTIGAGRLIKSDNAKIMEFFKNPEESENYQKLIEDPSKRVHIMGLCSDGKIHANIEHFILMYESLVKKGFKKIYFHLITDGRDTKVDVSYNYMLEIQSAINKYNIGKICTICGRYYAMDRDNNFDRTKIYYDLITKNAGNTTNNLKSYLNKCYEQNVTDEFLPPILLNSEGCIKDGDIILWMNYRADRSKQILNSFLNSKFDDFPVNNYENLDIYSFVEIDKNIKTKVFIKEEKLENPLGIYLSKLNLKQARISESEKFPHVTYFFDCGENGKIPNVQKFQIESPAVSTYDQKPEMSAVGVTNKVIECMEADYDFILVNFANPDMVGHTGSMIAATKACMAVDVCLNKIIESAEENFYTIILLADHGNCDTMYNEDGSICTTHSLEKVPFIISDDKIKLKDDGDLTNVAPTILDYMDISIPSEMTSESLIIKE